MADDKLDKISREFDDVVNMSIAELEDWLETQESRKVGWKGADGNARESVGHASGRRIVAILRKKRAELDADDYGHIKCSATSVVIRRSGRQTSTRRAGATA